jgi:Glycosyltransferase family 87
MSAANPLFDNERMRVYPRIFLGAYLLGALILVVISKDMVDPLGKPLGYDFITFYSASKLTLAGDPAAAFDLTKIFAAQQSIVPKSEMPFQWAYPPTFQLIIAPLALMPYGVAYGVFMALTAAAFFFALCLIPQARPYRLALMVAPGTALCIFHGQNALLTAALFTGGVALFERRPLCAGFLLGLLAFKPQMGLLLPIAFVAAGQWRAFFGAAAGALLLSALATALFGLGLWQVFFDHFAFIELIMRNGWLPWPKMPSAFVFCRLLGLPEQVALAAQIATALGVAGTVAVLWRRTGPTPLAWAALITGTLLLMPYVFDYELAILGLPLALLASDMSLRGAKTAEKALLLLALAVPFLMAPFAGASHLQIGFLTVLLLFGLCARRGLSKILIEFA